MVEQQLCLVGSASAEFMGIFDCMPVDQRYTIRDSRFNLCVACVHELMGQYRSLSCSEVVRVVEDAIEFGWSSERVMNTLDVLEGKKNERAPSYNNMRPNRFLRYRNGVYAGTDG